MGARGVGGKAEKRAIKRMGVFKPVFETMADCRVVEVEVVSSTLTELGEESAVYTVV